MYLTTIIMNKSDGKVQSVLACKCKAEVLMEVKDYLANSGQKKFKKLSKALEKTFQPV